MRLLELSHICLTSILGCFLVVQAEKCFVWQWPMYQLQSSVDCDHEPSKVTAHQLTDMHVCSTGKWAKEENGGHLWEAACQV